MENTHGYKDFWWSYQLENLYGYQKFLWSDQNFLWSYQLENENIIINFDWLSELFTGSLLENIMLLLFGILIRLSEHFIALSELLLIYYNQLN